MFVLLNKFDRELDEDVRVMGVAETQDELVELIEELDDLEGPLAEEPGYFSEVPTEASGRLGAPTVLRAGVTGAMGWYEIVQVG